jgi:[acyl-carrier-protein] S-malonyltransferase
MMNGYADFPIVRKTFAEASDILGQDFWTMAENGPVVKLNLTVNTQPLMLMAGVAVYRAWESLGDAKPFFVAGHSLGEYTALVASGALAFADALLLVRFRAEVMQQAVPEGVGGMAAILGLEDELVRTVCKQVTSASDRELLEPANFNSPGQIVIAGHRNAVIRGMELAASNGAKRTLMLPVSVPSHCFLMSEAAEKMQQKLELVTLMRPKIPVLHNADVQQHDEPAEIKKILVRHLCEPVRWTETIRSFAAAGVLHVMECGPGKVLSGLNKRIDGNVQSFALTDGVALQHAAAVLM